MELSMENTQKDCVLLAPAGNFECLSAALKNGANAVYFGVGNLNMRARGAVNFKVEELPEIVSQCHAAGAKAWLTLNTIIYEEELADMEVLCQAAASAGVDAVIAADHAVIQAARAAGLSVHLSVQGNVSNTRAVEFYAQFCDAVVLARELTLEQIRAISVDIAAKGICGPSGRPLAIEVFAHGALCIGISGRCGMSLCGYNRSSCRGSCFQNCRRAYRVTDVETGFEVEIDHQYIMSPKDICTLRQLPELLAAGCRIFKIEGRGRSADYVARVTSIYRQALDAIQAGRIPGGEQVDRWMAQLQEVFNRGFWEGAYYLGAELDPWGKIPRNHATKTKEYIGPIVNYYSKIQVAEVKVLASELKVGDDILVTGNATGALFGKIEEMRGDNEEKFQCAEPGLVVAFPFKEKLRVNDKLFRLKDFEPQ